MMPLAIKSEAQTEPPAFSIASPSIGPKPSISKGTSWKKMLMEVEPLNKASMKSLVIDPTTPTDKKYIKPIASKKIGKAKNLLRTILSNLSVKDSGIGL